MVRKFSKNTVELIMHLHGTLSPIGTHDASLSAQFGKVDEIQGDIIPKVGLPFLNGLRYNFVEALSDIFWVACQKASI